MNNLTLVEHARFGADIIDEFSTSLKDVPIANRTIPVFEKSTEIIRILANELEKLQKEKESDG